MQCEKAPGDNFAVMDILLGAGEPARPGRVASAEAEIALYFKSRAVTFDAVIPLPIARFREQAKGDEGQRLNAVTDSFQVHGVFPGKVDRAGLDSARSHIHHQVGPRLMGFRREPSSGRKKHGDSIRTDPRVQSFRRLFGCCDCSLPGTLDKEPDDAWQAGRGKPESRKSRLGSPLLEENALFPAELTQPCPGGGAIRKA